LVFVPEKSVEFLFGQARKYGEKSEKNDKERRMKNSLANKISCSAVFAHFSTETLPIEHVATYERDFTDVPRVLL
jgi:hypothetical protein